MPHDKYVQKLTEILEPVDPLYEYAKDTTNSEAATGIKDYASQKLKLETDELITDEFSTSLIKPELKNELQFLRMPRSTANASWNEWALEKNKINSFRQSEIFISLNNTPGSLDDNSTGIRKNRHGDSAADSSPSSAEKNAESLASDEDEDDDYCDTSDNLMTEQVTHLFTANDYRHFDRFLDSSLSFRV